MSRAYVWMLLAVLGPGSAQPALAQSGSEDSNRPAIRAEPLRAPLLLDGQLDERVYQDTAPFTRFVQYEPRNGAPATEASAAWVLFDEANLYIAVRNWDSQPARIIANELRHDSTTLTQNDQVTVTLDPFHDRRGGFVFLVNAAGGMLEETFADERNPTRDWNTIWDARVARFDGGWQLEIRIPFRSIRYRAADPVWGLQIGRSIRWKNEITFLAPLPVLAGPPVYRISYGADLVGLALPPPSSRPDVKAWGAASASSDRTAAALADRTRRLDAGIDLKRAFARGLTADVTINTDFAQVEEDEQQINLTRFNLFVPEKREFFLEGQGVFNFGGQGTNAAGDVPIMFFSRTIGFARNQPQDILAGGRLTGKAGAYNLGLVNVQTRDSDLSGAPAANTSVVRVRRDILRNSTVGLLLTDRSHSERGGGHNLLGGLDGVFSLAQYVRLNTYIVRTHTDGLRGDSWSYRGQVDYACDRYGATMERLKVGRDFNPEVGFLRRTAFAKTSAALRFSPRPRAGSALARRVRKFSYEAAGNYYERSGGGVDSFDATALVRAEFQSGDAVQLQYVASHDRVIDAFAPSPGVLIASGAYDWRAWHASYSLAARRRLSGSVAAQAGSFYNGTQRAVSYRGRVALATRLAVEPAASVNWISLPAGRLTTALVSTRVTAPLTPRLLAAALVQYNSLARQYSASLRLRWEYRPGSDLFLVYTESRDTSAPAFPDLSTGGVALKVTRTLGR